MTSNETDIAFEQASLRNGKIGNLFMGCAGVLAAWLSNSQAVLVDGLFSLIGLSAAILAGRVGAEIMKQPDQRRPLGYAAHESLFTTFRALSLLGLVAFAMGNAVMNILGYLAGGTPPELRYGPLVAYFVVVILVCFGLAFSHYRAWKATGRRSRLLRLEGKAALFDGLLSLAAGAGLAIMPLLAEGPLGWLTPIGDSVIVLGLCGLVVGRYHADFMKGLGELAGASAPEDETTRARGTVSDLVSQRGGRLVDFSAVRLGRRLQVQIYYDPEVPITASQTDGLTRTCDAALEAELGPTTSVVLITGHGRYLPPAT